MSSNETAEENFFKGLACFDANDFAKAESFFLRTLELAPGHIATLNNLAAAQYGQGKAGEAAVTARNILKIDERNLGAYAMLSNCQMAQADYPAALATCETIIAIDPTVAEPYCKSGYALNATGKYQEALGFCDRALRLQPQFVEALLCRGNSLRDLNRHDEAVAAYGEALSLKPDLLQAWLGRGNVLSLLGRYDEAIEAYDRALSQSDMAPAWLGRGDVLSILGRYDEAITAYDRALALIPDLPPAWLGRGDILAIRKQHDQAVAAYQKALVLNPDMAAAWLGSGYMFAALARHDEALAAFERALTLRPDSADAWIGRADLLGELKRYDDALVAYDKALLLKPELADVWNSRANQLANLDRYDEAITSYDRALRLNPDLPAGWFGRGNSLNMLERHDEALEAYGKALALNPELAEAWSGRGSALSGLRRHDEAFAAFDKALVFKPGLISAQLGRGNLFFLLDRWDEAIAAYDVALSVKPDLAEAWIGRGNALALLDRWDDSVAAYDAALSAKPDMAEAWLGRANVSFFRKRFDDTLFAFDKAFSLRPNLTGVEGGRLHAKMQICDWHNFDDECQSLISSVRNNKANTSPFAFLGISRAPEDQMRCAELWVSKFCPASSAAWRRDRYDHDRLRVAYLSADFHEHATAHLMAGVFEQHDKSKFNITAISIGPNDNSPMRRRLEESFEQFVDAKMLGDAEVAGQIRAAEIDILIDLKGFTRGARTNILARRAAPIQVNYLGYPGTMGASYFDYVIADSIVVPISHQRSYSEKIVRLPDSYQATDASRNIADRTFTRAECGLPAQGFVFCCFNNNNKLTPGIFDSWMRILKSVEGSVLWLFAENAAAVTNIRKEASLRGIDPARFVFAERMSQSDHLARQRLAGLFLDTLPYNAHTTASDALWAGLPVLTQIGETFAGRVAASLLNALGLPELITHSQAEYEKDAIDLATNPARLALIKDTLARNRLSAYSIRRRLRAI